MQGSKSLAAIITAIFFICQLAPGAYAQQPQPFGTIRGTVSVSDTGQPVHNAAVLITQLRRSTVTREDGSFEFQQVPPGLYDLVARLSGFGNVVTTVRVTEGGTATADFEFRLAALREEVTVTATGAEQVASASFQSIATFDSIELAQRSHPSLGEVLQDVPGVAKRDFGPGSARPVIRGFDGDRVLVMQDGVRVGSLGSQSGDHGEPVDTLQLERIEIVRGPATLLYGSNAIGGVVNAITGHHQFSSTPTDGFRGYLTALAGTTNNQGGISGGFQYGARNFLLWGSGSGQRTGDYNTPIGRIENSFARSGSGSVGLGYFGNRAFFSVGYNYDRRRYGVPFAGMFEHHDEEEDEEDNQEHDFAQINLLQRRHNVRISGGFRDLDSPITGMQFSLDYANYQHQELEGTEVGTTFDNRHFVYRGEFEQRRAGHLSGRFGFWGMTRDYETIGAEALVPGPIRQNAFALFGLQEITFERIGFQFGGRLENNRYRPALASGLPDRSFTGFSGAAGVRVPLWEGGSFVANYTHSFRAPALEELYNFGPHIGNLTFEIGNPNLRAERSNGIDFGLRHSSRRLRADASVYYYRLSNFIFLAPQDEDGDGEIDFEDGLLVASYAQGNSRFLGTEIGAQVALVPESLWLVLGLDAVSAELRDGTPLPRIPPLSARVGLDARFRGFSVRPEVVMVNAQNDIYPTETRTAGYTLFNLRGSYMIPRRHHLHVFSVDAFNLGDRLYRNHLSFIKDLAPEIGRGVRFSYTVRFF